MSEFWHGKDGSVWANSDDRDHHDKLTGPQPSTDDLVKLTDYNTGKAVYIKPSACTLIRNLEAAVYDVYDEYDVYDSPPQVLHRRTRVDAGRDTLLVLETAEEVERLLFPTPIINFKYTPEKPSVFRCNWWKGSQVSNSLFFSTHVKALRAKSAAHSLGYASSIAEVEARGQKIEE